MAIVVKASDRRSRSAGDSEQVFDNIGTGHESTYRTSEVCHHYDEKNPQEAVFKKAFETEDILGDIVDITSVFLW